MVRYKIYRTATMRFCYSVMRKGNRIMKETAQKSLLISEKYNLTIKEAVEYFNIGEKSIRRIVADNPTAEYILMVGNKVLLKRKLFEQFIDETGSI